MNPYTKLRLRRKLRRTQQDVEKAQEDAAKHFKKHVSRRWSNLQDVRRFVLGWITLVLILALGVILQQRQLTQYYRVEVPANGGTFVEGVVGEVSNLNPIFATNPVDRAASRLIFNGLLRYNEDNELIGDLAESWSVDETGEVYTVKLKEDIYWHDGEPVTADDVVFTFKTIQHPDTRSPLNTDWRDITIQSLDEKTVTFALPNTFVPFVHSLTTGILPSHLFEDVKPIDMRAHDFNLAPVAGTGPFKFQQIVNNDDVTQIGMVRNESYHLGAPRLDQFIIRVFPDHEEMIEAFKNQELSGMAALRTFDAAQLESVKDIAYYDMPQYNIVFDFYKVSDPILSDVSVRKALTHGTDRDAIFELLNKRFPLAEGPLLAGQVGFDADREQAAYNIASAQKELEDAGWVLGADGIRVKGDTRLNLNLVSQNTDEYPVVAEELQRQWREIGVDLNVDLVSSDDLQQNHVIPHNYQVLLLGVSIGIDPDEFVYWHSNQAEVGGFNLSEVKSISINTALEAGRTRVDEDLRAAKYNSFVDAWNAEVPATALYRPIFTYGAESQVSGIVTRPINSAEDRYFNVQDWSLNTKMVDKVQ